MRVARRVAWTIVAAAATFALGSGCEVVALVSAVEDDGYPPVPTHLPECPGTLSQASPASETGARYQQIFSYPLGLEVNPRIAKDEAFGVLVHAGGAPPRDSGYDAHTTGGLRIAHTYGCADDARALVVELAADEAGPATLEGTIGTAYLGRFDFDVAEPTGMIISYEVGSRFRANVLDASAEPLFAELSIEWEAIPSGFLPGYDVRGTFAPPIAGSAPEVTLYAYRGDLVATRHLRRDDSSGGYVPAD